MEVVKDPDNRHEQMLTAMDDGGLTWVPPSIFSVYGLHIKVIRPTVAAAEAKLDLLTTEQRERADFQLKSWKYADAVK